MARYKVQGPDGAMHIIEGPDGAKPEDIEAFAAQSIPQAKEPTFGDRMATNAKNTIGGLVRGAGSIGNTILAINSMGQLGSMKDRAQGMDAGLKELGADPSSLSYKGGKLVSEIAGTAGTGGVLAGGAKAAGAVPELVNAIRTGGFSTGSTTLPLANNLATRSLGGLTTGGATVGLVSPEDAGAGAMIGGALPGVLKVAGMGGNALAEGAQAGAKSLMGSALKGTAKMHQRGDVDVAVQTLLDYGINPTKKGVEKIKSLIGELNDQVSNAISSSSATVDPKKVVNALAETRQKFGNQVAPTSDLKAIGGVEDDFLANAGAGDIPVQLAQKLKQGTYSNLRGKYGQMGSAETEAQKGLARGLKDEISSAVPAVAPLNAEESRLIRTLTVTERRALMDVNKNPLGLAALAVHEPSAFIAFMADKSAAFKSLTARALNSASQNAPSLNALAGPAAYRSLPRVGQQNRP